MNTRSILHTASILLITFTLMQPARAQDKEKRRWGFDVGGVYTAARPYGLDLAAPGFAVAVLQGRKPRRTWRLCYVWRSKTSNIFTTPAEWIDVYGAADVYSTREDAVWFHDVHLDWLLRPKAWISPTNTGVYVVAGIGWRALSVKTSYPDLTDEEYASLPGYLRGEEGYFDDLWLLLRGGFGYDRQVGPLRAFAEFIGEASCVPDPTGAGDGFTFGYHATIGLRYCIGERQQ